jgi:hypothetical protein
MGGHASLGSALSGCFQASKSAYDCAEERTAAAAAAAAVGQATRDTSTHTTAGQSGTHDWHALSMPLAPSRSLSALCRWHCSPLRPVGSDAGRSVCNGHVSICALFSAMSHKPPVVIDNGTGSGHTHDSSHQLPSHPLCSSLLWRLSAFEQGRAGQGSAPSAHTSWNRTDQRNISYRGDGSRDGRARTVERAVAAAEQCQQPRQQQQQQRLQLRLSVAAAAPGRSWRTVAA